MEQGSESSEGLEARCNVEDLRKLDRKQPDQVGKVFRVAGYARMHRQMRSSENSARTPVDRSDLSLPPRMYHLGVEARD